jgi:hypothetical protein
LTRFLLGFRLEVRRFQCILVGFQFVVELLFMCSLGIGLFFI